MPRVPLLGLAKANHCPRPTTIPSSVYRRNAFHHGPDRGWRVREGTCGISRNTVRHGGELFGVVNRPRVEQWHTGDGERPSVPLLGMEAMNHCPKSTTIPSNVNRRNALHQGTRSALAS